MKSFFILCFSLLLINIQTNAQQNFWEPSNGPYGDAISDIAVNSSNNLFASNIYGNSMYFSSNGGENWTIRNGGLPSSGSIYSIVINQDDFVFAGTYSGLYRSTDNGGNWNNVFDESVTSICLDENDYLYACDYNSDYLIGMWSNLYRSTDQGISWQSILFGEIDNQFLDVVVNQSGHIFVCTFWGIYRSLDNGGTWDLIDIFKPKVLAIQSNGFIYGGGLRGEGVYRSSDNGNNWEEINSGLDSSYLSINVISINENDEIFIGTTDPNNMNFYIRKGKNYRSTDDGNSWIPIDSSLMGTALHTIEFDTTGNIFGGTNIGVFFSSDNGNTWIHKSNGMRGVYFNSICADCINNLFGVISGLPTFYKSSDNGLSWEIFTNDFPFSSVHSIAINQNGHFFAGIYDEETGIQFGICRSTDNGTSWEIVLQDLEYLIKEIKIKQNGDIFAIADIGIFRSTNNGDNWNQVFFEWGPSSLDFNNDGHIFATLILNGVYRSTDNGENWIQINNGLTSLYIRSIAVNHNGYIFVGSGNDGVFKSTDNGDSWHQASSGLSHDHILSIAINQNGYLFAGTYGGVFWSTDNGENWSELNSGLTGYTVYKLSINPAGYLLASTDDGMFKSLNTTTDVNTNEINPPSEYLLHQNYPNPFNPNTTIKYQIPEISFVTIKVYDVLGKEIVTLVDEEKPAGEYNVEFRIDNLELSSGIFFYQLQAGNYIETKKMVLLK